MRSRRALIALALWLTVVMQEVKFSLLFWSVGFCRGLITFSNLFIISYFLYYLLLIFSINIFLYLFFARFPPFSIWPKCRRTFLFAFRAFRIFSLPKICLLKRGFVISRYLFMDFLHTGATNIIRHTYNAEDLVIQRFVKSRFYCISLVPALWGRIFLIFSIKT